MKWNIVIQLGLLRNHGVQIKKWLLGVAQFVQIAGVSFEEIDTLYDEIKEKLEKLLDK